MVSQKKGFLSCICRLVPRNVVSWDLRKNGEKVWLVRATVNVYEYLKSSYRKLIPLSMMLVQVGVHQGLVGNPLFIYHRAG